MSKVIQNIKSNIKSLSQNLSSLLHRGQKSKDPYNNKRLYLNSTKLHRVTLGTGSVFNKLRCSSTFRSYINKHKNLRIAGFTSALSLAVLSVFFVYPIVKNFSSAEAATGTAQESSLTLNVSSMASVNLLVSNPSGNFASSDTSGATSNFTVATNNVTGYTLTIAGSDDKKQLVSGNNTIDSITSATSLSSGFNNGEWGYKPSKLDSSSNSKYLPGPTTTATTLDAPNSRTTTDIPTTTSSTSNSYTIDLGIKADYSTAAGNYSNTYVLAAVPNPVDYIITYAENTGDVTNLPNPTSGSTSTTSITLTSNKPTRTGYNFSGWCLGTVGSNGTTCTGTTYASGGTFYIDKTTSNITTLYAVWTIKSYTLNITNNNTTSNPTTSTTINFKGSTNITVTPADGYYLSEVTCPTGYTCTGYTTGSDATGAQTVTVANGDGTNGTDAGGTIEFTAESAVDGYLQDFTASECSAMSTNETKTLGDTRDGNTYTITKLGDNNCWMTQNLRYMGDTVGSTSSTTTWYLKSATSNVSADTTMTMTDLTSNSSVDYNTYDYAKFHNSGDTSKGVWYNYAAASAMTITGSSNENTQTYDICPKGWRLPTNSEQSGITSYSSQYSPVTGGYYYGGSPVNTGYGYWWSAASYSSTGRYVLYYNGSSLDTDYYNRRYGFYVRCVKKSAVEEVAYLQDMTPALADSMATGQTLTLKDKRDEESYLVGKLADGNLWLLDNLRLGSTSTTALTPSDTNIASNYTLPASGSWTNSYDVAYINSSSKDTTTTSYGSGSGKVGVYYNYCAATAGTYCYASDSGSGNASYDICPKGWRMPTGGSSGEYQALYTAYSSNATNFRNALSTPLSGRFSSGSAYNQGSYGYFWSSTRSDGSYMYYLYVDSSDVSPTDYYVRYGGLAVRCVLDTSTIADATYMQDVTNAMVANTADGATKTLTDSRDSQQYTVAKINGNLWMTRNLAIGCNGSGTTYSATVRSRTLSSSNSNVSSYTTPTTGGHSNTYTEGKIVCDATYGAWYNYYAATGGTISGDDNSTDATYDICPKGWRLPTHSEQSGIISYEDVYSPVTGSRYYNGSPNFTGTGYWWSATSSSSNYRYGLGYDGSSLGTRNGTRVYGLYVRCVRSAS